MNAVVADEAATRCAEGRALLRRGLPRPALPLLAEAAARSPHWAEPLSQLAHAYALLGDWERAAAYDRAALDLTSRPGLRPLPVPSRIDGNLLRPAPLQDGLPVVIVNRDLGLGEAGLDPLPYAVAAARRSSPRSPVVVLGDASNRHPFVEHHLLVRHFERATVFAAAYRHVALPARYDFTLFAFQRFFVLLEFMEKTRLDSCLHIDPDVLLSSDATAHRVPGRWDLALSAHPDFGVSAHCCFVATRSALERFCAFATACYAADPPPAVRRTAMHAAIRAGRPAYVTDMLAFEEFGRAGIGRLHDLSAVHDGGVWDPNVASPDGFRTRGGVKDVRWVSGQPFCTELHGGRGVRFHALHFNNWAKSLIPRAHDRLPLVP